MAEKPHKKLEAWKKSIKLTLIVYNATTKLPDPEKFGLVSQMRRSAVSIASNIAEGAARNTRKEFTQFLCNARGSLSELDTQVLLCKELGYFSEIDFDEVTNRIEEVSKLLTGLIKMLRNQQ